VYARADRKARVMPMALIMFGVNPILWAAFASVVSVCWIFCLSFVSICGLVLQQFLFMLVL